MIQKHHEVCDNEPDDNITDSKSVRFKLKFTDNTSNGCTVNSSSIKILLLNCETNLTLTWLENCVIYVADRATTFTVVTISTHTTTIQIENYQRRHKSNI